jgi:hypothetical protein
VGDSFIAVKPTRILDTHNSIGLTAPIQPNVGTEFAVVNQTPGDPAANVPADAVAVTGVLSVSNAGKVGFLSLTSTKVDTATTSNLNFPANDARAAGVTALLSDTGSLWVLYGVGSTSATADVAFDVTGYFVVGSSGSTYHALTPNRIVDSRPTGSGHTNIGLTGVVTAGTHRNFNVVGIYRTDESLNVPVDAVAVIGNLTVTAQTAAGKFNLGPEPLDAPTTASIYFPTGDNRATGLAVKLAPDSSLNITYTSATVGATAHVIFDVTGFFVAGESGAMYVPVATNRLVDTRTPLGMSKLKAATPGSFQVTDRNKGLPINVPPAAVAITGTLTVTGQSALGFLSLTTTAIAKPTTSTMNFPKGDNRATGVTVPLGIGGKLYVTYGAVAGATTHCVFDVSGYFVN